MQATFVYKGGKGSGFHGHAGRKGLVGGSSSAGAGFTPGNGDYEFPNSIVEYDKSLNALLVDNLQYDDNVYNYATWQDASNLERARIKDEIVSSISKQTGIDKATVNDVIGQWAGTSNDNDMRSLSLQEACSEEFGVDMGEWQAKNLSELKSNEYAQLVKSTSVDEAKIKMDEYGKKVLAIEAQSTSTDDFYNHPELVKAHGDALNNYQTYKSIYEGKVDTSRYDPLTSRNNERKILRAMYDNTQESLAKQGLHPDDYVTLYRGYNPGYIDVKSGNVVKYHGNAMESWSVGYNVAHRFATRQQSGTGLTVGIRVKVKNIMASARTGFGCLTEGEFIVFGSIPNTTVKVLDITQYDSAYND